MIVLVLALALAQAVTPDLRQHVEAGLRARAAGNLDEAAREFQRVVELAPELAAAHVNLGSVYFQKGEYAKATGPLRRALALNGELPGAHQMLGTALLALGAAAEALPHLEKAQAGELLGIALLEAGRPRESVDRLEAALTHRPGDPDLLYYLSRAHGELSKTLFDRLRAEPAGVTRAQQMMGEAAMAAGQRDAAERHFRGALAARADLRGVHLAIGELYLEGGDYAKAEPEFRAEAKMTPLSAIAAYKLGLVLLNLGRAAEAVTELERAAQLRGDMPETYLALGKAQTATGNSPAAETALKSVLKLEPESALGEAAHLQLSQLYRRLGRTAEADTELRTLQELRRRKRP